MLTVTTNAGARLTHLLDQSENFTAVRIVGRDRQLKLRRDQVRSGDATFAHSGRVVLVLDSRMSRALSSRTLDVRETSTGPRLSIQPR
jgi:Fe-S cluster assembly iron-binding protein IscA